MKPVTISCLALLGAGITANALPTSKAELDPVFREKHPANIAAAARGLTNDQLRLLAGGLWLSSEASGFTLNFLKFKKNYGRRDLSAAHNDNDRERALLAHTAENIRRGWVPEAGRALFGLSTVLGMVSLPIAYSNAAMLPYPKHPTTRRRHVDAESLTEPQGVHPVMTARSKIDRAAAVLGVAGVGLSLLGLPLNVAMYQKMQPQHLDFPIPSFHG